MKFWRVTGVALGIEQLLQEAQRLLEERRFSQAILFYNRALEREPHLIETPAGQAFFRSEVWFPVTAVEISGKDILPFVFPSYAPGIYEAAAATPDIPFPIMVEYADGKVQGKISTGGTVVFFEASAACKEFAEGLRLAGQILRPAAALKIWDILPGKKQRLGSIDELFGAKDVHSISKTLGTFRVFPVG